MAAFDDTLRELFDTERSHAAGVLSAGRDRDTPVKLSMGAGGRADRTFLTVFQNVACRAGCSFCCHGVRVDVTAPEVLTLARGFRETLPPERVALVLVNVRAHATTIRSMSVAERYRARLPCVLLDTSTGRCTVHAARPMRCRAHHSLNARDCEDATLHPDEKRMITRLPQVLSAHEAMIGGQKSALSEAGLDARPFELSLALEVALAVPDAAERWARGEPVFDAAEAVFPEDPV